MIDVSTYEDGLPISIVIPTISSRKYFLNQFVLPLAESNMPKEIIVVCGEGNVCVTKHHVPCRIN